MVNISGEVIGVNVAVFTTSRGSERIGFSVPVNETKRLLQKLLKGEEVLEKLIGIEVQDVNRALAEYFELKKPEGVLIVKIIQSGAGEEAGFRPEDIIVKFDEKKILNTLDFLKCVLDTGIGEKVKVKIIRNGLTHTLKLKISGKIIKSEELSKEEKIVELELLPEKKQAVNLFETWRGLKVMEITEEFASNFSLEDKGGVIVTEIAVNSPAEKSGIRVNDIILQINTNKIETITDYYQAVSLSAGNTLIKTNRGYLMVNE
ncbi:MAG: PDZ domain-containing protein [Candidatus Omnitrophica bacterium]|nr:PDZ domain-containing protein [Candidatus Omnitrophota bacterium]